MKYLFCLFYLCFTILLSFSYFVVAQPTGTGNPNNRSLKLMTYNLNFASPTFEPSWEVRRDMQIDMIRKYAPDIIGTQEGLKDQIDYNVAGVYPSDHKPICVEFEIPSK